MKKEVIEILKQYHQEHILDFLPILNQKEQNVLEEQIENLDFQQLECLYENVQNSTELTEKKIEPIGYTDKEKLSKQRKEQLEKIGEEVIRSGHYAVITMAGGQGTRLRT